MIRVLGDRVLVALAPPRGDVTTDSGLVLVKDPDAAKKPTQGIVMALGEKVGTVEIARVIDMLIDARSYVDKVESGRLDGACCSSTCDGLLDSVQSLKPAGFDVAIGDCVLFPTHAGDELHEDGIAYVVLHESDIIGILEPLTKDEAA